MFGPLPGLRKNTGEMQFPKLHDKPRSLVQQGSWRLQTRTTVYTRLSSAVVKFWPGDEAIASQEIAQGMLGGFSNSYARS